MNKTCYYCHKEYDSYDMWIYKKHDICEPCINNDKIEKCYECGELFALKKEMIGFDYRLYCKPCYNYVINQPLSNFRD